MRWVGNLFRRCGGLSWLELHVLNRSLGSNYRCGRRSSNYWGSFGNLESGHDLGCTVGVGLGLDNTKCGNDLCVAASVGLDLDNLWLLCHNLSVNGLRCNNCRLTKHVL